MQRQPFTLNCLFQWLFVCKQWSLFHNISIVDRALKHFSLHFKVFILLSSLKSHITLYLHFNMAMDWNPITFLAVSKPHLPFEAELVAGKSHRLSPISCPPPTPSQSSSEMLKGQEKHEADMKYPQRLRRLHIFPTNKAEVLANL